MPYEHQKDASAWHALERMSAEVGWRLTEETEGTIRAIAPLPRVSTKTQAKLMLAEPEVAMIRGNETRIDYLTRLCAMAGITFEGPAHV